MSFVKPKRLSYYNLDGALHQACSSLASTRGLLEASYFPCVNGYKLVDMDSNSKKTSDLHDEPRVKP